MTKHYKNEQIMKILTVLGALVGLATIILGLVDMPNYAFVGPFLGATYAILNIIVGIVIVVLTFLVALKPNKPLPFHWIILFILGILLVAFGAGIWACVLVIIAAIIGLIEAL